MDRRTLLKWIGASALTAGTAFGGGLFRREQIARMGADRPAFIRKDPKHFHNTFRPFKGVSQTIGKNVFLFHNLQREIGEIIPHDQSTIIDVDGTILREGEGDCVGQAAAMGADILAATNIHMLRRREAFIGKASVEMLYAGSRVEIGRENNPDNPDKENWLQGRGGSNGEWVARFMKEYGVLHRIRYTRYNNTIDLSGYSPERSRKYRDVGVPDWLEMFAREHPVKEITNVHTGQEALDAICAGQPVILCSSYAFRNERDNEGFTTPYLGTGWRDLRRQWWHAMLLTGAILEGSRKGGVIQNSHGVWNEGPRPYGMPEGSFAVELRYLDLMVQDWYDCYALSAYRGHEARKIRHRLYLR